VCTVGATYGNGVRAEIALHFGNKVLEKHRSLKSAHWRSRGIVAPPAS
jgi:hypothetical protein